MVGGMVAGDPRTHWRWHDRHRAAPVDSPVHPVLFAGLADFLFHATGSKSRGKLAARRRGPDDGSLVARWGHCRVRLKLVWACGVGANVCRELCDRMDLLDWRNPEV